MKETESRSKNINLAKSMNVHKLKYKCMNFLLDIFFQKFQTVVICTYLIPQIREQMSGPDLYVLTVVFLALKKTVFSEKNKSADVSLC